jgi:hypothetical protein
MLYQITLEREIFAVKMEWIYSLNVVLSCILLYIPDE